MRSAEFIAWVASAALHTLLLLTALAGSGPSSETLSAEEERVSVSLYAVTEPIEPAKPSPLARRYEQELVPIPLQPVAPATPEVEGEAWSEDVEEEIPTPEDDPEELEIRAAEASESEGDASLPEVSRPAGAVTDLDEDAVRVLDLVLDLTDPAELVRAARTLGLRFLVISPGRPVQWMVELIGADLEEVRPLDRLGTSISRRGNDLSASPWFRERRERAVRSLGWDPTGSRIALAIPAGPDRVFLQAEMDYLRGRGAEAASLHRLFGRLVEDDGRGRLEIYAAE